jgi:hypothetical protein
MVRTDRDAYLDVNYLKLHAFDYHILFALFPYEVRVKPLVLIYQYNQRYKYTTQPSHQSIEESRTARRRIILRNLHDTRLHNPEQCCVLAVLGPADNLAPVHLIRLLFARVRKCWHIILGDAAEDHEEARKHAGLGGD